MPSTDMFPDDRPPDRGREPGQEETPLGGSAPSEGDPGDGAHGDTGAGDRGQTPPEEPPAADHHPAPPGPGGTPVAGGPAATERPRAAGAEPTAVTRARSNGLSARSFVLLTEIDPRVATELLAVLAAHGVAAYAEPHLGSVGAYLDHRPSSRPVDRLWVDAVRHEDARLLVDRHLTDTSTPGDDLDEVFRSIVADFYSPNAPGTSSWPESENLDGRVEPNAHPPVSRSSSPERPHPVRPPLVGPDVNAIDARRVGAGGGDVDDFGDGLGEDLGGDLDDDDEHYEPPPPPPIPRFRIRTWVAVGAILAGIGLLLLPAFGDAGSDGSVALAVVLIVCGGVDLVWRLHDGPSTDDRPDDGAVV